MLCMCHDKCHYILYVFKASLKCTKEIASQGAKAETPLKILFSAFEIQTYLNFFNETASLIQEVIWLNIKEAFDSFDSSKGGLLILSAEQLSCLLQCIFSKKFSMYRGNATNFLAQEQNGVTSLRDGEQAQGAENLVGMSCRPEYNKLMNLVPRMDFHLFVMLYMKISVHSNRKIIQS